MKFNIKAKQPDTVQNHEGANAYKLSPEMELYAAVVTAGLSDTFYEKGDTRIERIQALMLKNDPEYVAKLAVYARTAMYLRSVPLMLAVELAKAQSGNPVVAAAVRGVVKRADEITELLAYYQRANNRTDLKKLNKLSKQIQKGLATAFNMFDAYQFAKYNREAEITLRDALFLIHPKAKDEAQQLLFNKIASGTLVVPYTWETQLSAVGQINYGNAAVKAAAVKRTWEELIDSGKIGYMALMRNLRNLLQANVSEAHIRKVCAYLSDEEAVANAKQFPFRFLAAYREIKLQESVYTSYILTSLEKAVLVSATNIKGFARSTKVLIACDVSGSMQMPVSAKSKVLMYDIGLMLGMLLHARCEQVVTGMFGDNWKVINLPNRGILAHVEEYYKREGEVGYATNGYKIIKYLIANKIAMDKVFVFTDCQLWNTEDKGETIAQLWKKYTSIVPSAKLYLFDLAGHGHAPVDIQNDGVYLIAGWSDKVFDVLDAVEHGTDAVEKIKQVVL
jgi:60 kDa SS-A/Ro ribonucleoprotein